MVDVLEVLGCEEDMRLWPGLYGKVSRRSEYLTRAKRGKHVTLGQSSYRHGPVVTLVVPQHMQAIIAHDRDFHSSPCRSRLERKGSVPNLSDSNELAVI